MSSNEIQKEDINALILELSNLQSYAEVLRQQIELSNNAIIELTMSKLSLEEIKRRGGNAEILIPIGAGNFIRASIKDVNSVIVNVGANVSIEKGIDIAISDIEEKIRKIQSQIETLRNQYIQVISRIEELQVKISQLSEKK
ncbi:MAG: prefoldin subunit alpha [Candidatus Verstraetearchaeota archaeon]|nr:prefoldin subunit alpha [Candidatus Verstraetearchaeota archaeon]